VAVDPAVVVAAHEVGWCPAGHDESAELVGLADLGEADPGVTVAVALAAAVAGVDAAPPYGGDERHHVDVDLNDVAVARAQQFVRVWFMVGCGHGFSLVG
jgi:hypothetical protein